MYATDETIRMVFSALLLLLQRPALLGTCNNLTLSICWLINASSSSDRPETSLWLNSTELTPIGMLGKFISLSVSTTGVHTLKLKHGGNVRVWSFSATSGSDSIMVRSEVRTHGGPTNMTSEALMAFKPDELFACENGTLYLQQDNLILALGYTRRMLMKVESWGMTSLLVSWLQDPTQPPAHSVSLYRSEVDTHVCVSSTTTHASHHTFGALEPCHSYVACLETLRGPSVHCLQALTDPEVPRNFQVTSWNASSLLVAWGCPQSQARSRLVVTALQLNATGHVLEERSFRLEREPFILMVADLPPCSKVKLSLQTVCHASGLSRNSRKIFVDGNSANSEIENLHQTSSGPGNYTLSWLVRNYSSISAFRVYHQGALLASTFLTTHTVTGLQPCHQYWARVEAVCGEGVVMSARTIQTSTGPGRVSDLRFQPGNGSASWVSASGPTAAFGYRLFDEVGSVTQSGRVSGTAVTLQGLVPDCPYELRVWEECGQLPGSPSSVHFVWTPTSRRISVTAVDLGSTQPGVEFDMPPDLSIVVPWNASAPFEDLKGRARAELQRVIWRKLQDLFSGFPCKVEVHLVAFEDFENKSKMKITFQVFNVSGETAKVKVSPEEQIEHVRRFGHPKITIRDNLLYWDDLDECVPSQLNTCGSHSICLNTLDSYTCVCQPGYYDVGRFHVPPVLSACHKGGVFTQCKDSLVAGGVSKAFLREYFGGNVTTILNDGRCSVNETADFYIYRITGSLSKCGAWKWGNRTHVVFHSVLTVTLSSDEPITRRDLKVRWACTYPRLHWRRAHVPAQLDWFSSHTIVAYNSSHILKIGMTLYSDVSFTHGYTEATLLKFSDYLFFELTLQSEDTLAHDLLLEVVSCWATETSSSKDNRKAFLLKDGCPTDGTFQWQLPSGSERKSRFSVQMFTMSAGSPIYVHCLTRICSPDESCTTMCAARENGKIRRALRSTRSAVVSAGPISINSDPNQPAGKGPVFSQGLAALGGGLCVLVLAMLGVSAAMTPYLQPK